MRHSIIARHLTCWNKTRFPIMPKHRATPLRLALLALTILTASMVLWWWLGLPARIAEQAPLNRLQCVSYTPLAGDETPADLGNGMVIPIERLRSDLALLRARFDCVRTYSVTGLEHLPAVAQELGMQVLLGAWVNGDARNTRLELDGAARMAAAYPQTVRAVVVGNEVLLRQELSATQLTTYISEMQQRVSQPVTYADVWEFHLRYPQVSAAVDFITIHILPYWEDKPVAIDDAVAHVKKIYTHVAEEFPGRELLIGETGWPSRGRMREGSLPSPENEARFVRGFLATAHAQGWSYNLIEALDQPWKRGQEGTVGGYWGLYDAERQDKAIISGAISNHPHWPVFALSAAALGIGLLLAAQRSAPTAPQLQIFMVALIGGNLLALQLEQYQYDVRNMLELFSAGVMLIVAFAATLAGLHRDSAALSWRTAVQQLRRRQLGASTWQLALLMVTTILALALVADPRYRSFPAYGLLLPAALYAFGAWRQRKSGNTQGDDGREEWLLGTLLLLCTIGTALQEGMHNWQAGLWMVVTVLLALGALLSAQRMRAKPD